MSSVLVQYFFNSGYPIFLVFSLIVLNLLESRKILDLDILLASYVPPDKMRLDCTSQHGSFDKELKAGILLNRLLWKLGGFSKQLSKDLYKEYWYIVELTMVVTCGDLNLKGLHLSQLRDTRVQVSDKRCGDIYIYIFDLHFSIHLFLHCWLFLIYL